MALCESGISMQTIHTVRLAQPRKRPKLRHLSRPRRRSRRSWLISGGKAARWVASGVLKPSPQSSAPKLRKKPPRLVGEIGSCPATYPVLHSANLMANKQPTKPGPAQPHQSPRRALTYSRVLEEAQQGHSTRIRLYTKLEEQLGGEYAVVSFFTMFGHPRVLLENSDADMLEEVLQNY